MKKSLSIGTCTAIVGFAAAALFAQTPAPQTTTAPDSDKKVTITGCLKAAPGSEIATAAAGTAGTTGTAGATGATGTTGASDAGDAKYVLSDATLKPADAPGATAPSESTPAAGAATTSAAGGGQTYRLIANPAALTPHVGKKLELTGTLEDESGSASSATAGSSAQGPALRVESGKVVAASCSQ